MALILNIDTATDLASVCISNHNQVLAQKINPVQKEHASFIHEAIKEVIAKAGKSLNNLDAVSVTAGPGSYTGLRVGMATAKGICYVINKPLITINTLEAMARAAIENQPGEHGNDLLFCPMIDARRMEVFTAVYNTRLESVLSPCAMVLNEQSFEALLKSRRILFFGNGSEKFSSLSSHPNAQIIRVQHSSQHLVYLAEIAFAQNRFANLAYSEPLYIKEFHSTQ